jgi:hypothetical protein
VKDARALTKEHLLFSPFDKIKEVMNKARSSAVSECPELVKQQC